MAIYKGSNFIGLNSVKEKKVYVEVPEGSTIDDMSEQNTIAIQPEEYAALQDAVNWRTGTYNNKNFSQMVTELNKNYFVNRDMHQLRQPYRSNWTRPSDWPDLDSLNLQMSGDDYIYMTYRVQEGAVIAWHINTLVTSIPATVELGHINNGQFIADEVTTIANSANYVRWLDDLTTEYVVIRITGQLTYCYAITVTANGRTCTHKQQPLLERIAWVPNLKSLNYSNSYSWGSYVIQSDVVGNLPTTPLNYIAYAWIDNYCLQHLDISNLYTNNVTNMTSVFNNCRALRSLDLSHWNTSKVTTMSSMFSECRGITSLNLTGWDTQKVTNFSSIFNACGSLQEIIGLENFNTSAATNLGSMFANCQRLESLPIENFNTDKVTTIAGMFSECYNLKTLDLHKWNPNKITNFSSTFNACWSLKYINFNGWETTGVITSISSMFANCQNLQLLDISWLHITSACTSMGSVFSNCRALKQLEIPNDWDVSGLGSGSNTGNAIFNSCYSLESITGISNWHFQFENSLANAFDYCYSLKTLDISGWTVNATTNLTSMFRCCYSLQNLDLSNWRPANCTSFASLFQDCWSLRSVGNLDAWPTGKVTNFSSMFSNCTSLPTIPNISLWDMSKATTMASMFYGMTSLTEVIINNLNIPACTTIATLFQYCYNLKKIEIKNWTLTALNTAPGQLCGYCNALYDVTMDNVPIKYNISFAYCYSLSYESILNILNALPTVTTTRTLTLRSDHINRLTSEEKAIATNKGWTIST